MNEIVHKCTRGYVILFIIIFIKKTKVFIAIFRSKKKTEPFVVKSMFKTVERILSVARPQKLLFLAFDGVVSHSFNLVK
jgi:5'-3' exonuclease